MIPKVSKRHSTFAFKAAAPGGLSLEAAVRTGEARVEAMRDRGEGRIDGLLATLDAHRARPAALEAGALRECERAADELVSLAGLFGIDALRQVAGRLCRHLAGDTPNSGEVLGVFVDAARLARARPDLDVAVLTEHLERLAARA